MIESRPFIKDVFGRKDTVRQTMLSTTRDEVNAEDHMPNEYNTKTR